MDTLHKYKIEPKKDDKFMCTLHISGTMFLSRLKRNNLTGFVLTLGVGPYLRDAPSTGYRSKPFTGQR